MTILEDKKMKPLLPSKQKKRANSYPKDKKLYYEVQIDYLSQVSTKAGSLT